MKTLSPKSTATDRVSFVVPVRDDADRLQKCLASIVRLRKGGATTEVVVVDNGSADESPEVAGRMGALVLRLPGLSVAQLRNRGVMEASGNLVAFVDADHVLDTGWLDAALDAMTESGTAAAGAPYVFAGETWVQRSYERLRPFLSGRMNAAWLGSGNLIIRRDLFLEVGGFDENLETCEDVDLCQRLRGTGLRLIAEPKMRSIHLGDPSTLRALFLGELWRGRDNLRVTLRGPWTPSSLASLIVSGGMLIFMSAIVVAGLLLPIMAWSGLVLAIGIAGFAAIVILRATKMTLRGKEIQSFAANLIVGTVYESARAIALVVRTSHRVRRSRR